MDGQTSSVGGGNATPEPLPASVATDGTPPDDVSMEALPVHASDSVVEFDGLRGGQARRDGLIPGSQKAIEMDRVYDRIRKWMRRHPGEPHPDEKNLPQSMRDYFAARRGDMSRIVAAETRERSKPRPAYLRQPGTPPPLPSMPPVAETSGNQVTDINALAAVADAALDVWSGTDLEPVLEELSEVLQDLIAMKRERQMMLAGVDPEVLKKFLQECEWPERLEKLFCKSIGRLCAKLLNSANVPIAYKDEIIGGTALLTILSLEIRNSNRTAKMLAELKKNPAPK